MSAGKTYVGGTAYDIVGGKTLVGGTAYDITAGKTLVGGTAYDMAFGATKSLTFLGLMKDMTILSTGGKNNSSQSLGSCLKATYSGTSYLWSIHAPSATSVSWGIYQVQSKSVVKTIKSGGSYGGYCDYNSSSWRYANSAGASSATSVRGCTMAEVSFPSYSDAEVESILSGINSGRLAARNASTTTNLSTSDTSHDYIICARSSYLDIRYGSTYDLITGTETAAGEKGNNGTIYLPTVYCGAILYVDEAS